MKPKAVHQFSISCHYGDGITNGMLFTRRLLREAGVTSDIFCDHIDPELAGDILDFREYEDSPDNVLLIHHGIGNGHEDWLEQLPDRKLLVFHNITPAEFFAPDDPIQGLLTQGWEQLHSWNSWLSGAIADSDTNLDILLQHGYEPTTSRAIPLLVDLDRIRPLDPVPRAQPLERPFNLLFVGRVVPHKNQSALIEALPHVRAMTDSDVHLTLVGSGDEQYLLQLEQLATALGVADSVHFAGKVSDSELARLYARSDLYVSMSRHEGFGMPLIEAMAYRLPVVAMDAPASNITRTLGAGGIVVSDSDPITFAATVATIVEQPGLRRELVIRGSREMQRFDAGTLYGQLQSFLASLDIDLPTGTTGDRPDRQAALDYRIEGPFDSSYSLAIVNRNLGLALGDDGKRVALHPTEGPGDYLVDTRYLEDHPELLELCGGEQEIAVADTVLRLTYPTRLTGMNGINHGLSCYGWEESSLPRATASQINQHAHFVTTMSDYVTRTLIDNGINVPIATVGIGVDHILSSEPAADVEARDTFRILHISSCLPRKGVDVLLEAYSDKFMREDNVSLVIKTFPNPHHDIQQTVRDWRAAHPGGGDIKVIEDELDDAAIHQLYCSSHVLAAPSRGEGFGLPLAEAMLHRVPVVTTGYGGQLDFCNENTAWLVDFDFAYSETHFDVSDSVWANPRADHLGQILREHYEHFAAGQWLTQISAKVEAAHELISTGFSWKDVAGRVQHAVAALDTLPAVSPGVKFGCVTTWNSKCGIATYSKLLLEPALPDCFIFANREENLTTRDDETLVRRCWQAGFTDDLTGLRDAILESGVEALLIQFNFSFFDLDALKSLLRELVDHRIDIYVTFHSTADVTHGETLKSLRQLAPELLAADRLFVHSVADLNNLKDMGMVHNTTLFPHGVNTGLAPSATAIPEGNLDGKNIIASYGFLLPNKGIQDLIHAFARVAHQYPQAHLLLLNALYPVDVSIHEEEACRQLIAQHGLDDRITLITDFMEDRESAAWLSLANTIVFPYKQTQESSSAAVRWGLACEKPVYCTPLSIFEDVRDVVSFFAGTEISDIEQGLSSILSRGPELRTGQKKWLADHDWQYLSQRLRNLIRSNRTNKSLRSLID